jgi:hypothetical protein
MQSLQSRILYEFPYTGLTPASVELDIAPRTVANDKEPRNVSAGVSTKFTYRVVEDSACCGEKLPGSIHRLVQEVMRQPSRNTYLDNTLEDAAEDVAATEAFVAGPRER